MVARNDCFDLIGYSDADHGRNQLDRKSTSGTCQFLGNSLVSWFSKKQNCVAVSTTESEYVAVGSCVAQICGLSNSFWILKLYFQKFQLSGITLVPLIFQKIQYSTLEQSILT